MDSIDKLLSELKAEYQQPDTQAEKAEEIEEVEEVKVNLPVQSSSLFTSSPKGDAIDNLLAEVKQDFEEKQLLEEQLKQQELEKEQIRQEKLKVKQLKALEKQAKEWLDKLEPLSTEGLWFESFAKSYPDKLEAAIEYLNSEQ